MPPTPATPQGACTDALNDAQWAKIYAAYFGEGTTGHCGDCHGTRRGGLLVGDAAEPFLTGMIESGLVNSSDPPHSTLIDPRMSPLRWFNANGPEPRGSAVANEQAAADVKAWLTSFAMAPCNASPAAPPASAPAPQADAATSAPAPASPQRDSATADDSEGHRHGGRP
jgi:hypothetical protein